MNVGSITSLGNEVSRMRVKMELKRSTRGWAVGIDGGGGGGGDGGISILCSYGPFCSGGVALTEWT